MKRLVLILLIEVLVKTRFKIFDREQCSKVLKEALLLLLLFLLT